MNNVTANPGTSHSGMEMVCLCRAFVASCRQHFEMELFAKQNTRPAEIANRFLSLADRHSHRERELEFYAREMGISPKYLSAVIMSATKKKSDQSDFRTRDRLRQGSSSELVK